MKVKEFLGTLKHTRDCSVCKAIVKRFWYSAWGVWIIVFFIILCAYALSALELYNIVAGFN